MTECVLSNELVGRFSLRPRRYSQIARLKCDPGQITFTTMMEKERDIVAYRMQKNASELE